MKVPLDVLLVEDSADDALLVLWELQRGGYAPEYEIVETVETMRRALENRTWDIIISDYSMPGFSAPAALKLAKERDRDLPFIVVSGAIGEETAVEVMKAGAHDFLLKDKLTLLPSVVERELRQAAVRREHRNTQKALQKEEQKYGTLLQTLTDLVFILQTDGKIDYLNPEFERLTGYPVKDYLGRHFTEILAPEHIERAYDHFKQGLSGEDPPVYEVTLKTRNGSLLPVEVNATSMFDADGGLIGRLGLARDIRSRKLAEEALKESANRYRSMMESMQEPVYIRSADFRVEYMNPTMVKRTGRNAVGELCFKALHDLDNKCPWCLQGDEPASGNLESEIISPRDNRSYHVSQAPLVHGDGSASLLTVLRDITDLKKMEAQLHQAQKMESIGTLAGGIAHDFNNILFPIIGYTEMLLEDIPERSPLRDSVNGIYAGALRATDLVKQILTFSRQDSNDLKEMRLQPVITDALKLIRSTISTEIEIEYDIRSDCGPVKADPTQIHQIVMNLATNAYHAMEEAGGKLKVSLKEVALGAQDVTGRDIAPGRYACLTIADTGTGIDENFSEKIFDPFFTTKENDKGTGLGLSVVHGIVKTAGGDIRFDSLSGEGTKFYVYLPVMQNLSKQQGPRAKNFIHGGTEQILFVDDEEAIVEMEKQVLERLGYQVVAHCGSIGALEVFRASPDKFDMVITDMAMPQMSGETLAMELKKIRPDIPILLCTGFSEKMSRERARQAGIAEFLTKPVIKSEMARTVRKVFDKVNASK